MFNRAKGLRRSINLFAHNAADKGWSKGGEARVADGAEGCVNGAHAFPFPLVINLSSLLSFFCSFAVV